MTSPDRPSPWWSRGWRVGIVMVLVYEFVALRWGKPLTGVARKRVLHRALGSAVLAAGMGWWFYHWHFDPGPGMTWLDPVVALVFAAVGYVGWVWREHLRAGES